MNARDEERAVLDAAMLRRAHASALEQGRPQMAVLQETAALPPAVFLRQLAALFRYPAWTMAELQAALPAFALLPYTDCAQRDCVLLQPAAPGAPGAPPVLVIGNPFAEDLLQWADFALSTPFTVALAHPDDLAAYLLQQESVQQAMLSLIHI